MKKGYENMRKYGEEMEGKFSRNPSQDGIVISVTKPFVEEIRIEIDDYFYHWYGSTYLLLEPQATHPKETDRRIYYNTQEKCYYRSEWGPKETELKEPEWGHIWVQTNSGYIVEHARTYEELQVHFRMYRNIHKGQLCFFRGYAIGPNGECKRPSTVESMFDRHKWLYNPFSFEVKPLDKNTIDDFVEETPISKKMTQKMVRYHKLEGKTQRRAKIRGIWRNLLDKISKSAQFVEKYPTWFVAIIGAIAGSLFTFFLSNIGTILKWFLKQSGG